MTGVVYSRFFWADWLSDVGLRACSARSRGIWMDMLCIAAAHDPQGYVAIKRSEALTSRISRGYPGGIQLLLVEQALEQMRMNNSFSGIDRKGRFFSRRMV